MPTLEQGSRTPARRRFAIASVASLVAVPVVLLVPSGAQAALTGASLTAVADLFDSTSSCAVAPAESEGSTRAVADDGRAVSVGDQRAATLTGSDSGDKVTLSGTASATTTVTPMTAAGGTVQFASSGTAEVKALRTVSGCAGRAVVGAESAAGLTLPSAMWVTATVTRTGSALAEVEVVGGNGEFLSSGEGAGTSSATYLIPAGPFRYRTTARVEALQSGAPLAVAAGGSATVTISLRPVGAAGAITGAGARFAVPGVRSCSSNVVGVRLTKAIKGAKQVELRVNGTVKRVVKGKRIRPQTLSVWTDPTQNAVVTAEITPKRGKRVAVARSYLACA